MFAKRFLALSLALLPAAQAHAEALPANLIQAEMLPGWRTESGTQMAALRITLAPGWKTYWRSPGEGGIPPEFDWSGSENLADAYYHWPTPQVFDLNGYRTLAYLEELVLPIEFVPAQPGQPMRVTSSIHLGVCEDICVPLTVEVAADLSLSAATDGAIVAALDNRPASGLALGLAVPRCSAEPIRDGIRLTADIALGDAGQGDFAVVELDDRAVWTGPVESRAEAGRLVQVTDLVPVDAQPFALNRAQVRLTAFAGGQVIEFIGCKG